MSDDFPSAESFRRLRALVRLLTDEGHMTPYAAQKITDSLDGEDRAVALMDAETEAAEATAL